MAETAEQLLSFDEFLTWDDGTDRRYQLLRGVITMMAPAQVVHGALVIRLGTMLGARLLRGCSALSEAGIKPPHRNDTFYVANLAVTCRPLERGEVYLQEPVLIVEVLSPSTAATDRILKLDDYRRMPPVQDILFVSSTSARVEHWHREGDGWKVVFRGPSEQVEIVALNAGFDIDELYQDLPLETEEPPPA